jgi:dolichyl-phosphate-mannose--protein O-mannosyl transferase
MRAVAMMPNALFARAQMLGRSTWKDLVTHWNGLSKAEQTTSILLAFMIVGGIVLRIQGIALPFDHTFDEALYVDPAHHYLLGVTDLSDRHPPLSKLLLAVGMLLFGHNPLGWRFMALCFGIQSVFLAYWVASALFENKRAGWMAAAFVAADGFFISYSRTGLPDGILNCLVLWSMLAAITARSWRGLMVAGVLIGAAVSVKWSGLMVGVPALVAVLVLKRARWYALAALAVVPIVHWAIWVIGLKLMGHPSDLKSMGAVMVEFFTMHKGKGHLTNPLASPWYTWPFLYHPIVVKLSTYGLKSRYSSSIGNPLVWFAAGLPVMLLPIAAGMMTLRMRWRKLWDQWFDVKFANVLLILIVGWGALLTPWIMWGGSYAFWYHYMPCYSFAVLLLAGGVARLERRWPRAVLVFVALTLTVAIYFAPVWGEFLLSTNEANRRLIFLPWRP